MPVSEDNKDILAEGGRSALQYGMSGAAAGSAILPGPGTAIGAAVGLVGGFVLGASMEKRMKEEQKELDADIAKSEKEAAQFALQAAKQSEAAATKASATGKLLGGPVPDVVLEAVATGTGYDAFKRSNFPQYG